MNHIMIINNATFLSCPRYLTTACRGEERGGGGGGERARQKIVIMVVAK